MVILHELTEDKIKKYGVFFVHGDQLTVSLLETVSNHSAMLRTELTMVKASGSRHDDKTLSDNPSRFVRPVMGLFHAKIAGAQCVANEHWGVANSKTGWSLWKILALLGCKMISGGWKSKQAQPYQVIVELVLRMSLVTNILNGFRLYCGHLTLEEWVASIKVHEGICKGSAKVPAELVSAQCVESLHSESTQDVVLENVILFNCNALILHTLQAVIKQGDIGTVVNVLAFWMVMFRGTGKMPKYADILFSTLVQLKTMDSKMR